MNFPTQITPTTKSLIGNIFYNNASNNIISGNITTSISDNLAQFLLVLGQPKDIQLHVPKAFEKEMQRIDWNSILQLPFENSNLSFSRLSKIKQNWRLSRQLLPS